MANEDSSVQTTCGPDPARVLSGIRFEQYDWELTIVRRWFLALHLLPALLCVFWDTGLVLGLVLCPECRSSLFFFALCAISVGLTYETAAWLVNTTVIRASGGYLTVRHGPVPWPGNRTVSAADVEQLYCAERSAWRPRRSYNGGSCCVHAILRDGRRVKLVSTLLNAEQARFVEQTVERCLGIEDRPVEGELPRLKRV